MSEEDISKKIQSCEGKIKQKDKTIFQKSVDCNLSGSGFCGDKFDDKFDEDYKFYNKNAGFDFFCGYGPNGVNGRLNFNAMKANSTGGGKKDGSGSDSDDSSGDSDSGDGTNRKSKEGDKKEGGKDKNGGKNKRSGFLGLRKKGLFGSGAKSGSSQEGYNG